MLRMTDAGFASHKTLGLLFPLQRVLLLVRLVSQLSLVPQPPIDMLLPFLRRFCLEPFDDHFHGFKMTQIALILAPNYCGEV